MRRSMAVSVVIIVFSLIALLATGCANKAVVSDSSGQEKAVVAQKQSAAQKQAPVQQQKTVVAVDSAAQAKAKAEKELKAINAVGDVYFAYDKYNLNEDSKKTLQKYVDWLSAHPQYSVRIEGNCDERGTVEYNLALGERRATAAMKYIVDLGIDKNRISVISYGKEKPVDQGHDEASWWKNRRDHLDISVKTK